MIKIGTKIIFTYLLLVIISLLWIKYLTTTDPSHSEFSGVWFVVMTLPWSVLFGMIIDRIDPYFYPRIGIIINLLGAAINCVLIYLIFSKPWAQQINEKKKKA
jgi:drug/metabolite transporter superfamily protein YnfA